MGNGITTTGKKEIAPKRFDKRRAKYLGIIRSASVLTVLFLQVFFIAALTYWLRTDALKIYFAVEILSVIVAFALVNHDAYNRIFWIVILLVLPGFGFILYFFWGSARRISL